MKIGVMLRHLDQHEGGVKVYTRNLLRSLLALDTEHEFVLMYQNPAHVGTYARHNVREVAVPIPTRFGWDQVAVRYLEKKQKFDVIFNPKYSVPFLAECPTVFVCHGLDWFVMPWGSRFRDRLSHRYLVPRYMRKADAIIAVSDSTRQHLVEYLRVDAAKITRIYLGVNEDFLRPLDAAIVEQVRHKYRIPRRFFLYVGQIYPPKNFGNLLRAYARVGPQMGIPLVVAGTHTWLCEKELELIVELGLESWIVEPGWIEHDALHVYYALADALLLPSLYEACPSPLLEAMAVGCPIVTSNRYGNREIAGDAALLVDPGDVGSIADGIRRIATEPDTRARLVQAGRERVKAFSWEKCALETLAVLEKAGAGASRSVEPGARNAPIRIHVAEERSDAGHAAHG
jgi:glycosyltransferase involved in cell wall biosynthesis